MKYNGYVKRGIDLTGLARKDDRVYPEPDRSNHKPNFGIKAEKDYLDLGWNEGILSDGRPFRVEYWCWDSTSVLTYFMSSKGIENANAAYFRELLVNEGLLSNLPDTASFSIRKMKDASGNKMWSVNVAVGDEEELYVDDPVYLRLYEDRSE